mmetsp:Transcript_71596/g.119078  ORF Transcript_71596/g.119078 Transcript_71596/m.119078 type:complete len:117 (-) Transcript_71596:1072-1422(-)
MTPQSNDWHAQKGQYAIEKPHNHEIATLWGGTVSTSIQQVRAADFSDTAATACSFEVCRLANHNKASTSTLIIAKESTTMPAIALLLKLFLEPEISEMPRSIRNCTTSAGSNAGGR